MELSYRFPNKQSRNRWLSLIAQNVGTSGYGFGLEFDGLEFSLESDNSRGDLVSHVPPKAKGHWELAGSCVKLDVSFIAAHRPNFDHLQGRLFELACQFGGSRY
jgi:hypothetical protein